jgi:hypothetical protein
MEIWLHPDSQHDVFASSAVIAALIKRVGIVRIESHPHTAPEQESDLRVSIPRQSRGL